MDNANSNTTSTNPRLSEHVLQASTGAPSTLPAAYQDSCAALEWLSSHKHNSGSETWLQEHEDFERVFLAGDGADIAMLIGEPDLDLRMDIRVGDIEFRKESHGGSVVGNDDLRVNPITEAQPAMAG